MSDTSDKEQPIDTALTTEETSDVQPSDLGQDVQTERNGNSNIQPSVEPSETEEPEIKPDETAVEDFKRGAENEGEADTGDNNDVFDPSLSEQQGDNNEFKEDQKGIQASEQNVDVDDEEEDVYRISNHKLNSEEKEVTKKKKVRKSKKSPVEVNKDEGFVPMNVDGGDNESRIVDETPEARRRRLLEEKMDSAIKTKTVRRRKADEDDIERMQDDRIDLLKDKMIKAANLDVEKNSQGLIATEKLKLLREVTDVLTMADLAISILDNNLLETVRLWLEPLPDASMPAYQIQKELIFSLTSLPIKTDHLVASGIGKVLVFYQRSKRTEPNLKKVVDRLIGDWTRPILNKSDSYKDRTIQFLDYNRSRFANKSQSSRRNKPKEGKTLYEENAERRRRAAIPSARTTAYSIAPKVDPSLLRRGQNSNGGDERFKRLNQKLTSMNVKKKANKKSGPSIEGRNLPM